MSDIRSTCPKCASNETHLNPWDFAALLNEKRAGFCGREWLFDAIDAWWSAHPERALLITGDPGVGKSALVAQLVVMPLDEFNSWKETLYLLSSPANAAHLRRSIAQAESGQAEKRELTAE